ncbi:MAG: 3-dehydroquinate synthase [Candidatus Omnitrophica bacterium]|nr:3-dehydroquinate synthase [Candidatus Omnitrophota bacterium]
MKTTKVNLKERSYNIVVGRNIINSLGRAIKKLGLGSDAYVVTNATIKNKYGPLVNKVLSGEGLNVKFRLVADSEKSKSLETAYPLLKDIAVFDKKKKLFIVALGGGVIGDLSGFIASIYRRGTPYINIPTTLLAQIDSAIGGKTAVDLKEGKNLVGSFYQPALVYSEINFLKSLDKRQLRAGLSEAIKYAVIRDPVLFAYLEKKHKSVLSADSRALEFIVNRCSSIKAGIVSLDEKEKKGLRTILNFGHTAGHAIEAAGGYKKYNHGEAVALGMLVAVSISKMLGLTDEKAVRRIENLVKAAGLPEKIKAIALNDIIKAHYYDKKFSGAQNKFVLIKGIGKTQIVRNIPLKVITDSIKERY